jgi:hypothetical protein
MLNFSLIKMPNPHIISQLFTNKFSPNCIKENVNIFHRRFSPKSKEFCEICC